MSNLKFTSILLIVFIIQCSTADVDRCLEKVENGIFRKTILPEADAWIIDETNGTIQFIDSNGNTMNVILRSNLSDSIDVECPDVSFERHLYHYQISDTSKIIAMERTSQFSVFTQETAGSSQGMLGQIDHLENLYLDARYIDQANIVDTIFSDLLLIRHNPNEKYLIDSVYFQRGYGLVSFQYLDEQMRRQ